MSHPECSTLHEESEQSVSEALANLLIHRGDSEQQSQDGALFIVYKTIEANPNITVNRLRSWLAREYLFTEAEVNGALVALWTSPVYNAIRRWDNTGIASKPTHISVRPLDTVSREFCDWLSAFYAKFPALRNLKQVIASKGQGDDGR